MSNFLVNSLSSHLAISFDQNLAEFFVDPAFFPMESLDVLCPFEVGHHYTAGVHQNVGKDGDTSIAEYLVRPAPFDWVSVTGLAIYAFGAVMLVVVIALLGRFWTVKLIIARDHDLVTHPLFRAVRHPNYYLNILPELVGYAVTLHAWLTLVVGLAIYMVPLTVRIRQEERVMRETLARY